MTADSDALHLALLLRPPGLPGSGLARYGAAMHFYKKGEMPLNMLEIYRICAKFDQEDPKAVAAFEGVRLPAILADNSAPRP